MNSNEAPHPSMVFPSDTSVVPMVAVGKNVDATTIYPGYCVRLTFSATTTTSDGVDMTAEPTTDAKLRTLVLGFAQTKILPGATGIYSYAGRVEGAWVTINGAANATGGDWICFSSQLRGCAKVTGTAGNKMGFGLMDGRIVASGATKSRQTVWQVPWRV